MMSSHSLIGLVQSFFTKSDVEAEDPMMAMNFGIASANCATLVACWNFCKKNKTNWHCCPCLMSLSSFLGVSVSSCDGLECFLFLLYIYIYTRFWPDSVLRMGSMGGAPMMPGGGPDPAKVYKTEQDSP